MNFVVAFKAEALPLIDFYSLKKDSSPRVTNLSKRSSLLIISGPGKDNAATSAKKTFLKLNGSQNQAWLNLGIAGHESLPKEIFIAAKIRDEMKKYSIHRKFTPIPSQQVA